MRQLLNNRRNQSTRATPRSPKVNHHERILPHILKSLIRQNHRLPIASQLLPPSHLALPLNKIANLLLSYSLNLCISLQQAPPRIAQYWVELLQNPSEPDCSKGCLDNALLN